MEEIKFLEEMVSSERRKRIGYQIASAVVAIAFTLLWVYHSITVSDMKKDSERLYKDNKTLVKMFEDQQLQRELLKKAKWSEHKIDEFIGNGCLMYIEIGAQEMPK